MIESPFFSKALGSFNVSLLGFLVSTAEQNYDGCVVLELVDTITGTDVNAHFADLITNRFGISRVAIL